MEQGAHEPDVCLDDLHALGCFPGDFERLLALVELSPECLFEIRSLLVHCLAAVGHLLVRGDCTHVFDEVVVERDCRGCEFGLHSKQCEQNILVVAVVGHILRDLRVAVEFEQSEHFAWIRAFGVEHLVLAFEEVEILVREGLEFVDGVIGVAKVGETVALGVLGTESRYVNNDVLEFP